MIHTLKRKKRLAVVAQIEALMASVPEKRECPVCHQMYRVGPTPHPCALPNRVSSGWLRAAADYLERYA